MKTFIKSKSKANATGPNYRTPDHFKASSLSGNKFQKP